MRLFKNSWLKNFDFWHNCSLGRVKNLVFSEHSCHFFSCRLTSLAHCDLETLISQEISNYNFLVKKCHIQIHSRFNLVVCNRTRSFAVWAVTLAVWAVAALLRNFWSLQREWGNFPFANWNGIFYDFRYSLYNSKKIFSAPFGIFYMRTEI